MKRLRAPAAAFAAGIAAWFLYFAHPGLRSALTEDDLTNLYLYTQKPAHALFLNNLRFWSTAYRPLGAAFYIPLYKLFGLDPLPYRIVCFALLGLNLWLLYHFSTRLSGSREIAFLATLLASYHAWFVDLYYNSGTIFELLFYALYLTAFLIYEAIRARGQTPGPRALAAIAGLYILALDAKEMAVTLPLFLLLYEIIFHTKELRRPILWASRHARAIWITGLITALYITGKLNGPDSLIDNSTYALHISPVRFLKTFHLYLNPLLYQDHWFHDSNTLQLLLLMLAVAAWRRSRVLLFSWCWLLLTILPVAFIPHYAAFFEYLPMVGWTLYTATLLVMIRRTVSSLTPRIPQWVYQAILIASVAAFLAPLHARETPEPLAVFRSVQFPSRDIIGTMSHSHPSLRRGARVLFIDDPFPRDSYMLVFATRLLYRDHSIEVERSQFVPLSDYARYDGVYAFRDGRLTTIR